MSSARTQFLWLITSNLKLCSIISTRRQPWVQSLFLLLSPSSSRSLLKLVQDCPPGVSSDCPLQQGFFMAISKQKYCFLSLELVPLGLFCTTHPYPTPHPISTYFSKKVAKFQKDHPPTPLIGVGGGWVCPPLEKSTKNHEIFTLKIASRLLLIDCVCLFFFV